MTPEFWTVWNGLKKKEKRNGFGIDGVLSGGVLMRVLPVSKEASRNLTLLATDGASEYSGVNLSPRDWATLVQISIDEWAKRNSGLPHLKSELRLKDP